MNDNRYVRVRCPICSRVSPTCDQQADPRRAVMGDWWRSHFNAYHRPAPIIERVEPYERIGGVPWLSYRNGPTNERAPRWRRRRALDASGMAEHLAELTRQRDELVNALRTALGPCLRCGGTGDIGYGVAKPCTACDATGIGRGAPVTVQQKADIGALLDRIGSRDDG